MATKWMGRGFLRGALVLLVFLRTATVLLANTTYSYSDVAFYSSTNFGEQIASLGASFTVASPLAPNLSNVPLNTSAGVISYKLNATINNLFVNFGVGVPGAPGQVMNGTVGLSVSTDSKGKIIYWDITGVGPDPYNAGLGSTELETCDEPTSVVGLACGGGKPVYALDFWNIPGVPYPALPDPVYVVNAPSAWVVEESVTPVPETASVGLTAMAALLLGGMLAHSRSKQ